MPSLTPRGPRVVRVRRRPWPMLAALVLALAVLGGTAATTTTSPAAVTLPTQYVAATASIPADWQAAFTSERPALDLTDAGGGFLQFKASLPAGTSQTMIDRLNGFDVTVTGQDGTVLDSRSIGSVEPGIRHDFVVWTADFSGVPGSQVKARARFGYIDANLTEGVDAFSDWTGPVPWAIGHTDGGTPVPPPSTTSSSSTTTTSTSSTTTTTTSTSTTTTSSSTGIVSGTTTSSSSAVVGLKVVASSSDPILRRHVVFTAQSPSVTRYEYAWAKTASGTAAGTIQRCTFGSSCVLSFRDIQPDTSWNLLARVVDQSGNTSPWYSQAIKSPPRPILVVGGDSIQSGHHRDSEGAPTICQDENYAMGKTVWNYTQAVIPAQWRDPHGYVNVAVSGFGTRQMLNGGTDGCGVVHEAEL